MKKISILIQLITANSLATITLAQSHDRIPEIDFSNIFNTQYTYIGIPIKDSVYIYAPPSSGPSADWSPFDSLAKPKGTIAMDGNIRKNIFMTEETIISEEYGRYDTLHFQAGIPPIDPRLWIRRPYTTEPESHFLSGEKKVCYYRQYDQDKDQFIWQVSDKLNPYMFTENRTTPVLTDKHGFNKLYSFIPGGGNEYLAALFHDQISFFRYPTVHDTLLGDKILEPSEMNFPLPQGTITAFIYDFKYIATVSKEQIDFYGFDNAQKKWTKADQIPPLRFALLFGSPSGYAQPSYPQMAESKSGASPNDVPPTAIVEKEFEKDRTLYRIERFIQKELEYGPLMLCIYEIDSLSHYLIQQRSIIVPESENLEIGQVDLIQLKGRPFFTVRARYSIYLFDLEKEQISAPIVPGTGVEYREDAISGTMNGFQFFDDNYLLGIAVNYGVFCFNISKLNHPKELLRYSSDFSDQGQPYFFLDKNTDGSYNGIISQSDTTKKSISVSGFYTETKKAKHLFRNRLTETTGWLRKEDLYRGQWEQHLTTLPGLRFEVAGTAPQAEDVYYTRRMLAAIKVIDKTNNHTVQVITDIGAETTDPLNQCLHFVDANFDGHPDIVSEYADGGAGPNYTKIFYLFDPASKQFVYHEDLSALPQVEVDTVHQVVHSAWRAGAGQHGAAEYRFINGKMQQTYQWDQVWGAGYFTEETHTIRQPDGQWIETHTYGAQAVADTVVIYRNPDERQEPLARIPGSTAYLTIKDEKPLWYHIQTGPDSLQGWVRKETVFPDSWEPVSTSFTRYQLEKVEDAHGNLLALRIKSKKSGKPTQLIVLVNSGYTSGILETGDYNQDGQTDFRIRWPQEEAEPAVYLFNKRSKLFTN